MTGTVTSLESVTIKTLNLDISSISRIMNLSINNASICISRVLKLITR